MSIVVQPLVDFAGTTVRFGTGLFTAIGIQIESNTTAMVGCARLSGQVTVVTSFGLVTVPEVLLTSNGTEARVDGDFHTGSQSSGRHLVEGTGCGRRHGVVGICWSQVVGTLGGQMSRKDLHHGVHDIAIAGDLTDG